MARTLLIVDDIRSNREILKNMLGGEYEISEASNGEDALRILLEHYERISAVLLDISMPGMNGYEVLRRMRSNAVLASVPVIMITGSENEEARVNALSYGANDFVMKPYSSEILRHCLNNNIAFHEAKLKVDLLRRDNITGLYNREAFFEQVKKAVFRHEPGYYIMSRFDIDKFRIINDQYGTEKGNEVLRHVAETFTRGFEPHGGICCRISADNFAVLYPVSFRDSDEISAIRQTATQIDGLIFPIVFSIGRYVIDDISLSPSAMYDRAALAAETVKGRYDKKIAVYDESMREQLIREQSIVTEMSFALKNRQFEVWFQPQYNHATDAMIGAEALVRWRHPDNGLIPPNEFIPVFERNGFIYELDKYVWEEVCRYLRKWIDDGRSPLPVSVNISRYDIYREDVVGIVCDLINKYRLPATILRLEITESAFAESSQQVVGVVKEFISRGFTVEIDDFGSGYSSLNTLKDVPAQILKLDMRFFQNSDNSQRGGNIVESVVRMAKWLGMSVISEGVETLAQANFLSSIGCNYIQGYLYAKPMPAEQYEAHCLGSEKEEKLIVLQTVENLDNNSFWDAESIDTLIFSSYVGAACIFEFHHGRAELIRTTDKYLQILGDGSISTEDALKINWFEHLDDDSRKRITDTLSESLRDKREVTAEYIFVDLPGCPHETYMRSAMRVIATAGDRYLVYCTNENITAQRQAEKREHELSEQMKAIMDNVDLGIIAAVLENGTARYLFANDRYYNMLGCTKETFPSHFASPYDTVAPEDRRRVIEETEKINRTGDSIVLEYRANMPDSSERFFRAVISIGSLSGIKEPVQLSILRDITESRTLMSQYELLTNSIPGGIATYEAHGDTIRLTFFNDGFCNLFGVTRDEYTQISANDVFVGVFPEDLPTLKTQISALTDKDSQIDCIYRVRLRDGNYKWINLKASCSVQSEERTVFNAVLLDITRRQNAIEQLRISEEENRLAMKHTSNIVCRYDVQDSTLRTSLKTKNIYQVPETIEDVPSSQIEEGYISSETADIYLEFYSGIHNGSKTGSATFQRRSELGWRWIEGYYSTIFNNDGKPASAVISFSDITDRLKKESAYRHWQQSYLSRPADSYSLFHCSVGKIATLESREGSLLNIRFEEGALLFDDCTAQYARQCVAEEDARRFAAFLSVDALLAGFYQGKRIVSTEYREKLEDGSRRWIRLTVDLAEHANKPGIEAYMLFENIDEIKRKELETIALAQKDPLTGVLNRNAFSSRVNDKIRSSGPDCVCALMMLDIDGFKQVNDSFGHIVGDQALIDVATSLRKMIRHDDPVGRLGGDEYLVFLSDVSGDSAVISKAKQICATVRKSFSAEVEITGSIGIAIAPRDGADFETLYKKADSALYHVKGSGKNSFAFYNADMSSQHLSLEKTTTANTALAKKRRMLIVDDSRIDHELLTNIFAKDFIIEKAKNGNDALIRLRHYGSAISVVLLDLIMPGMDGFEVLAKMQESTELQKVPVIVVSGDEERETGIRAIRAGAIDFVNKPVDPDILRARVNSAISKAENERLRAKNTMLEHQNGEIARYKTAMESCGVSVIENDWISGAFVYDADLGEHIAGKYDNRTLWRILLSDFVAESTTVQKMQDCVQRVAMSRTENEARIAVRLKVPDKSYHRFRVIVKKQANDFGLTSKIYLTFIDLDASEVNA